MLRYYDEKDLLKSKKDKNNGYRYYTDEDIEIVNKIKLLRKYNFSVYEIKNVLKMNCEEIKLAFQNKLDELNEQSNEYFDLVEDLKCYIGHNSTKNIFNNYDISFGVRKSFYAICLRKVVNDEGLELLIDKLIKLVGKTNFICAGTYFALFHSIEEKNSISYDVEVCQPILVKNEITDPRIKFFEEANYISTIHIGDYNSIVYAYAALYNWVKLNGYNLAGPYIEKYYTDEYVVLDKNKFVTEISIVVKNC